MASLWSKLPPVVEDVYKKGLHILERRAVSWENIFSREWDVCILIDACRYDLFQSVADDYSYIQHHEPFTSADSMTPRWMERTFVSEWEEELKRTAYVCGNPFGDEWVTEELLGHYEPVYEYAWDEEDGTVHPAPITNAGLQCWRDNDFDRLLVHYMQPHVPFVHWQNREEQSYNTFSWEEPQQRNYWRQLVFHGDSEKRDTWGQLKMGEVELREVKEAYRQNLEYVLDELDVLVSNIGADRTVLTSDHGNGYGEYGIYGHPMHIPFRSLREVPWCVVETTNTGEYDPGPKPESESQQDREQQLQALGYKQ